MEVASLVSSWVSPLLESTLSKLLKFASGKMASRLRVDEQLRKLVRTILTVQAVVDNMKSNPRWSCRNKGLRNWLRELENTLNEADGLLAELELGPNFGSPICKLRVRKLISKFGTNVLSRIVKMQQKLESLAREMDGIFMDQVVQSTQPQFMMKVQTTSLVDESSVVGRDNNKNQIIEKLTQDGGNVSVIAMVGMAGVGKTTLAQLIYNDGVVKKRFEHRIWVSISAGYTIEKITKSILESISASPVALSDLHPIQMRIQELITEKRVLVVLDSMWNENASDWDTLYLPFKIAGLGCRILVTTRSTIVSRVVTTTADAICRIPLLGDDDCWKLIKQRMLLVEDRVDHRRLVDVGKKIAKKCGGLPFAAKVLGSIMRFKFDEKEWNTILNCKLWGLPGSENEILPVLKLSYDYLPLHLKRCFAYCSIFPRSGAFKKDDLVQMWMAEGFIERNAMTRLEDIGREYFEVLVSRSLFQEAVVDSGDDQPKYKMHDLIYDLSEFVSEELCFRMEDDKSNFENARHLSILCRDMEEKEFRNCSCQTLIVSCQSGCVVDRFPVGFFRTNLYIKVLNLSFTKVTELPDSFGFLKQLRYLDVSNTLIQGLPKSITEVHGLQTLKLRACSRFRGFPTDMKKLTDLQHLEFGNNGAFSFGMPPELGKLTKLQTLPIFIVGKENGQKIVELKDLRHLHGSICITELQNANGQEASTAKLNRKPYLDKLELRWQEGSGCGQQVLQGLRPHCTIQQLIIISYGGSDFPAWLGYSSFYKLESIHLMNCSCTSLPSLGELPLLKSLHLKEMPKLAYVNGAGDFPSLETLEIEDMHMLEEWRDSGDMPQLSKLVMRRCPSLKVLLPIHCFASLKILEIEECLTLQSLPAEGCPNSLRSLIISKCSAIRSQFDSPQVWNGIPPSCEVEIDGQIMTR